MADERRGNRIYSRFTRSFPVTIRLFVPLTYNTQTSNTYTCWRIRICGVRHFLFILSEWIKILYIVLRNTTMTIPKTTDPSQTFPFSFLLVISIATSNHSSLTSRANRNVWLYINPCKTASSDPVFNRLSPIDRLRLGKKTYFIIFHLQSHLQSERNVNVSIMCSIPIDLKYGRNHKVSKRSYR